MNLDEYTSTESINLPYQFKSISQIDDSYIMHHWMTGLSIWIRKKLRTNELYNKVWKWLKNVCIKHK